MLGYGQNSCFTAGLKWPFERRMIDINHFFVLEHTPPTTEVKIIKLCIE